MTDELKHLAEELAEAYATGPGLKVTKVDKDNGVVTFTSEQVFDSACAAHFLAGFEACHEQLSAEVEPVRMREPDMSAALEERNDELLAQLAERDQRLRLYEDALENIANEHSHYIGALERNCKVTHPFHGVMSKMGEWAIEALSHGRGDVSETS